MLSFRSTTHRWNSSGDIWLDQTILKTVYSSRKPSAKIDGTDPFREGINMQIRQSKTSLDADVPETVHLQVCLDLTNVQQVTSKSIRLTISTTNIGVWVMQVETQSDGKMYGLRKKSQLGENQDASHCFK